MKRAVIIAKGRVQRVGYRDAVEDIARVLKISGFVANVKPYDVRIVAEGEDGNIDLFIKEIKMKKYPIDVETIEVSFEVFKAEFDYFEIKRGEWGEEIVERLDTAGKLLYKSIVVGEKSLELGERTVKLAEKSVELGEESMGIGREMLEKQDMMLQKQDMMLQKQDETIEEISGLRYDLKEYMEERFDRIEREVTEIKSTFYF